MIAAGSLDRRIQLLTKITTRNEAGEPVNAWTVTATIAAERRELKTADVEKTAGKEAVAAARYVIRWRAGVTTAMRVRVSTVDYAITGIEEPDRRQSLILIVEAVR